MEGAGGGGHPFYLTTYVDESCYRRLFVNATLLEINVIFDVIIIVEHFTTDKRQFCNVINVYFYV